MAKKRNGLLEIYRLLFCCWVLYYHHFFFFKNEELIYREAYFAVEFFFILGGAFLLGSMKKLDGASFWKGCGKVLWGRLKPLASTLSVVFCFNLTGAIIQTCKNGFNFQTYIVDTWCYLWFLPFLFFGIFAMYVLYRLVKNKVAYFITLGVLVIAGYYVEFFIPIDYNNLWHQLGLSIARALGGVSLGILLSRIPRLKLTWKKINFNYFIIPIVLGLIAWTAYEPKNAWVRCGIILLHATLIYFTLNTNCGGKGFDFIGALTMRMYIYMAILCMLRVFNVTYHRLMFFLDLALALTDIAVFYYLPKFLKKRRA